jgi:hypothetical protein
MQYPVSGDRLLDGSLDIFFFGNVTLEGKDAKLLLEEREALVVHIGHGYPGAKGVKLADRSLAKARGAPSDKEDKVLRNLHFISYLLPHLLILDSLHYILYIIHLEEINHRFSISVLRVSYTYSAIIYISDHYLINFPVL